MNHLLADMSTSIGGDSGLKPRTICAASTVLYTTRPLRFGFRKQNLLTWHHLIQLIETISLEVESSRLGTVVKLLMKTILRSGLSKENLLCGYGRSSSSDENYLEFSFTFFLAIPTYFIYQRYILLSCKPATHPNFALRFS